MSPLPWPLFGRADPYAGVAVPPVQSRPQSPVRVVADAPPVPRQVPVTADEEHAVMYRNHRWLRVEEDVVLARLAHLTDLHGPWTAAPRLFADNPRETPDV